MSRLEYTPLNAIEGKYNELKTSFHGGVTQSLDFRREQLRNLYYGLTDHEQKLKQAIYDDLHRPFMETELLELNLVLSEISLVISKIDEWTKDEQLPTLTGDIRFAMGKSIIRKTPYGVVLIIGPWNYPILCTVLPVVSAIAAGNTVLVKPTEVTVHTTRVLTSIIEKTMDPRLIQVVNGSIEETTKLLKLKWDKIMLTGSTRVGKIVSHAAAEYLTPVCLELGGKSPAIISSSSNLKLAAKRVAWGKLVNAGQTCIAPDYVIVDRKVAKEFIAHLQDAVKVQYPDHGAKEFGHQISDPLFARAQQIVDSSNATTKWQWGTADKSSRFFPPTLLYGNVTLEDSSMQDELFNPILPIIEVDDLIKATKEFVVDHHDYPLALYIFSDDKKEQDQLLVTTRSGSVMINDAIMYGGSSVIPFGGVGSSGTGKYHGKAGFDEFTYDRPVVGTPTWMERLLKARYPPYSETNAHVLRALGRPIRPGFSRTGKLKGQCGTRWLISLLVKKLGITFIFIAAALYYAQRK